MATPRTPEQPEPPSDELALLAAILAEPDDDTPRLVYADWLDDHADSLPHRKPAEVRARAAFIRAQIEYSRLTAAHPDAEALRDHIEKLALHHLPTWREDGIWGFVRGFAAGAYLHDLNYICTEQGQFISRHPIRVLEADEFWGHSGVAQDVLNCTVLARLTGLASRSRGWDGPRVALALTSPYLANLRMLSFVSGCYNRTAGARGIANATHLTNLQVLDLSGNEIRDEGLEALAGAQHLRSLRALRLGRAFSDGANDLTEAGITALSRSRCFHSLVQLVLDGNEVGANGIDSLLGADWIHNLTELNVADAWIGEPGLLALASSQSLVNLRRLDVSGNGITETIARAFLHSDALPNLTDLHLSNGGQLEEVLSEDTRNAIVNRFGAAAIGRGWQTPNALCIEDKICLRRDEDSRWDPTIDGEVL